MCDYAGARGQLTVRGRQRLLHPRHRRRLHSRMDVQLESFTVRQSASLRSLNRGQYPLAMDWTPIVLLDHGGSFRRRGRNQHTPFQSKPDGTITRNPSDEYEDDQEP